MHKPASLTRFIAASGLTNLADGVALVVWGWMASLLTRDPLLIALLPVALRLPWVVLSLPAGIVTDRVDRRRLIMVMDTVRMLAFAAAAVAVWARLPLAEAPLRGISDPALFFLLLGAAVLVGCAEVFRDNAAQTLLPGIVPHDRLERANGRLWSVELVGNSLLGPAVGAFLIAAALPMPFVLNAAAFALALGLMFGVQGHFQAPNATATRDWRRELAEGWRFLWSTPVLVLLGGATGALNLLHQMILIALVLHVQESFGLGPEVYGLILAAAAVGGILAGWVSGAIVDRLGRAPAVQMSMAIFAAMYALMPFAPGPILLGLIFVVEQFFAVVWNTVSVSHRQRIIPDALLGRVNSIFRLLAWGMMPVGLLLSGALVRAGEHLATREAALLWPFYAGGLLAILLAVVLWRPLGRAFGQA